MLEEQDLNIKTVIYIKLLDEDIDVWKPVLAIKICNYLYKINDDIEEEDSEFKNGEIVKVKNKTFSDNSQGMVAYKSVLCKEIESKI